MPDSKQEQLELIDDSQLLRGRDEEIKALDELFARSANYRNGKNYFELLRFINRLPTLAPFNAFLVHMQHPGVQHVATAAAWEKKFGRKTKRDARPLVILMPFGPVSRAMSRGMWSFRRLVSKPFSRLPDISNGWVKSV